VCPLPTPITPPPPPQHTPHIDNLLNKLGVNKQSLKGRRAWGTPNVSKKNYIVEKRHIKRPTHVERDLYEWEKIINDEQIRRV